MNVPLVDLKRQYLSIQSEINNAIKKIILSFQFIGGPPIKDFEEKFANAHEAKYAIGCASGTSAISLCLKSIEIKPGDEIITVPNTFIGTVEPIIELGAKPIFVDIQEDSYLMNPDLIEEKITDKTKAIIPVHLYGKMCDMEKIKKIADKHNLRIIEDAAQAHLAKYNNKFPGYYSDAAIFSFYPGKNLGAYGDAGAVITNNANLHKKLLVTRDHGREPGKKYEHDYLGTNERMDTLQAAILSVKLKYLASWTKKRQEIAKKYIDKLKKSYIVPNPSIDDVWHLFVIRAKNRDELLSKLKSSGIGAGIHYPIPLHLQPAFKFLGYSKGDYPISEKVATEILSLPMFPELTDDEINYICTLL